MSLQPEFKPRCCFFFGHMIKVLDLSELPFLHHKDIDSDTTSLLGHE